jgi:hypothetical protein
VASWVNPEVVIHRGDDVCLAGAFHSALHDHASTDGIGVLATGQTPGQMFPFHFADIPGEVEALFVLRLDDDRQATVADKDVALVEAPAQWNMLSLEVVLPKILDQISLPLKALSLAQVAHTNTPTTTTMMANQSAPENRKP